MTKEEIQEVISIGHDTWNGKYIELFNWLITPCKAMGGKPPIEYSKHEIINEIMRIEHGIYS